MMRRVPDVTKLRLTIDYVPTTPLSQIVADVVADVRERVASADSPGSAVRAV
jgi:hypothetical protein